MSTPYLDAAALAALLPWSSAIEALAGTLRAGLDPAAALPRTAVRTAGGELLLMPAESGTAVGVKLLTVAPRNPARGLPRIQALYTLFDAATLAPQLQIDGAALTLLRTPALSALAADRLAVPDARRLTVFGTGPQARAHVAALAAVRPIESIEVLGRTAASAQRCCEALRGQGFAARPGTVHSIATADILICATSSTVPVFDGRLPADHACVLAIGSHDPAARELDDALLRRARRIVVEDRATALREAGDLVLAQAAGVGIAAALLTLSDLVAADVIAADPRAADLRAPGEPAGLSVFKSVGMGWQDLAVAEAAYARWRAGSEVGTRAPAVAGAAP